MYNTLIAKIIGTKSEREMKRMRPMVQRINDLEPQMQKLTDAELRAKTDEFKKRLADGESLDDMMEEAFAVCREASKRILNMRHFDVQLIGGSVLHQGRISEMKTGEGKTLVATLPVYLNSLEGKGVHVVTVNDYLARRDADWMGKLYRFLGLTVGVIVHDLDDKERRAAYACDVTYGTNNEFGFDYLRDNMKFELRDCVQRGHHFAIVDEVDSILIDEARTPLIISGTAEVTRPTYFKQLKPLIERLVNKQIGIAGQLVREAQELLEGDEEDQELAAQKLFQAKRAAPKFQPLAQLLEDPSVKRLAGQVENRINAEIERELVEPLYFTVNEKSRIVDLNATGRLQLAPAMMDEIAKLDLAWQIEEVEQDPDLSPEEKKEAAREVQHSYDSFSILDVGRADSEDRSAGGPGAGRKGKAHPESSARGRAALVEERGDPAAPESVHAVRKRRRVRGDRQSSHHRGRIHRPTDAGTDAGATACTKRSRPKKASRSSGKRRPTPRSPSRTTSACMTNSPE